MHDGKFGRKGAIMSSDFIVGALIFMLILTITIIHSNGIAARVNHIEEFQEMQELSSTAINQLLLSTGNPASWQEMTDLNNVSSIGLALTANELSSSKVQKLADFNSSNYYGVRNLLGLGKYEVYFSVEDLNGTSLKEFGLSPDLNKSIITIQRIAYYDGAEVLVKLRVFQK